MKKLFILFLLLSFSGNMFSQKQELKKVDEGFNSSVFIKVKEDFYENGQTKTVTYLEETGTKKNLVQTISFYENGKVKSEGYTRKGKRYYGWWLWYENGNLEMEGNYWRDKKSGLWKFYNEDGTLKEEITYKNGKEIN